MAWTALLAACAFLRADAHGAVLTVLLGEWGGAASHFGVVLYHAATACGLFAAILCIRWVAGRIESLLLQAAATFLTIVFGGLAATGFLTQWMDVLLARWPANGFG